MELQLTSTRTSATVERIALLDRTGACVGSCYLIFITNRHGTYAILEDVFVEPTHRGRGIGTRLVKEAVRRARQRRCYTILATVNKHHPHLIRWYEKLGFIPKGEALWLDL